MTTKKQPRAPDLLRAAAQQIEQALIQLDMREAPCERCGTHQFNNWDHAKVYQRLSDTPLKLRGLADQLDDVPGGFVPRYKEQAS